MRAGDAPLSTSMYNVTEQIKKMDLVAVDAARINKVIDIYFHWKDLDTEIRTISGSRGINFPSELSEYMVCYTLNFMLNKASGGDAVDFNSNPPKLIEIKACSADDINAPSSFSPEENFDELIFARLERYDDELLIYRTGINSETIKSIKVNKKETFADQQKQNRRPRFGVYKTIIQPMQLEPVAILNLRTRKIIRKD